MYYILIQKIATLKWNILNWLTYLKKTSKFIHKLYFPFREE
jgi:hypothetical protein